MAVPFLACMALAAQVYHLPPRVLPAIQAVEGGTVGSVSANTNGTEDFGLMQINTIWIAPLARVAHLTPDDVRNRLINDPCFSIAAAAVVVRGYLNEERGDLMRAVGDYHSHSETRHFAYREKVIAAAWRLFYPASQRPAK